MLHIGLIIGVVPTIFIASPLVFFAFFFPGVAAAILFFCRKWSSAFAVLSISSAILFIHSWFQASLRVHWWGGFLVLWLLIGIISLMGMLRSFRRAKGTPDMVAPFLPSRGDWAVISILSIISLAGVLYCLIREESLLHYQQRSLLVLTAGAWSSLAYLWFSRHRSGQASGTKRIYPETVLLGGIGLASISLTLFTYIEQELNNDRICLAWSFEPEGHGSICSSPIVSDDCVFTAVANDWTELGCGAVHCLNRQNGEILWTFNDASGMKPVFSSPSIWNGRLYLGEGFHKHSNCKLFCLDTKSGNKLWEFVTSGHTESSPSIVDGNVYFGAGDDGIYCVDALTGEEHWHLTGPHVDCKPAVVDGHVYAGSGYGKFEVFCLDVRTGHAIWRKPVKWPFFGSPIADKERVYFGIGNGNFMASAAKPAGALLCLNPQNGEEIWRFQTPDAIHAKPVLTEGKVIFSCRDHNCYGLDAHSGELIWQRDLGSPVLAEPVLVRQKPNDQQDRLYLLASGGVLFCLNPADGSQQWNHDFHDGWSMPGSFISTPAVIVDHTEHGFACKIYVGASVLGSPVLHCFEERIRR